ncbi:MULTISPECIES: hypothetical protein [Nannocystis]|uniref:Uncharacterized protein n=1 Tax=Nannocystis radixulma TaxID=2995305 RepID=A0ABT5BEH3_9BACT|nr:MULTISPECIES: hypothetical protein [Nannocystis]MCY1056981.1 hypothetical protein [Nannocystis sp. SCPEA4]MDC0671391.1 hypothetical protein [Nannocystis radixulma]
MTELLNLIITILALIVAVVAGLWFGAKLAESTRDEHGRSRKSLSSALRETTTSAAVKLWRWRRARAREAAKRE